MRDRHFQGCTPIWRENGSRVLPFSGDTQGNAFRNGLHMLSDEYYDGHLVHVQPSSWKYSTRLRIKADGNAWHRARAEHRRI